jgi:broad specificity phosphatase PhoE
MTRIILIRHGQTAWNQQDRIRGQVDVPLDDSGLAQATATAARIAAEWKPVALYSSPLCRAVQTAQTIADRVGLEVHTMPGFNDMNFGQWQGLSPSEVRQRWPEMSQAWLTAPHTVIFPGGESLARVRQRGMSALNQVIEQHPDQDAVIVGHTVLNRVLLCAMLGLDDSHHWRIGQDTCAVNMIECRGGGFFIGSINDTCHLRPGVHESHAAKR